MVNTTCQMICYAERLISYNGQDPGYVGRYTTPVYYSVLLAGSAIAGTIYIGQQLLRGYKYSESNSKFWPRCASVVKWGMAGLAVAASVVSFIDQQTGFFRHRDPTYVYPIWQLGYDMTQCTLQCSL